MLVVKARCPNCGAPIGLVDGQTYVLCSYCDLSMKVAVPAPVAVPAAAGTEAPLAEVTQTALPPEDVRRVRQLILDGKHDEAVALYAELARISADEAKRAVDSLLFQSLPRLFRQMPVNAIGFSVAVLLCLLSAGGLALSVTDEFHPVPAVISALLLVFFARWLVPKIISNWVAAYGAEGRARVLRRSVFRPSALTSKGGTLTLVLFEVTPDGGGAPFLDEEPLLLLEASVDKLSPGHVVRVRFDEPARKRVFPITPIQVIAVEPIE